MTTPYRASPLLLLRLLCLLAVCLFARVGTAQDRADYPLGTGDVIRIQVFQNPDLTIETRISESGVFTYPLIGEVSVRGMTLLQVEKKIANALQSGGFVRQPQVNIALVQIRGNLVSILGQVNRPGRFPLETTNIKLSDMLATAGGIISTSGDDTVIVTGQRDGKPFRKLIDIPSIYLLDKPQEDIVLMSGDTVYVQRAAVFYIYGEAQRPGAFRIERGMTIMQALAQGGGPTQRGTEKKLRLSRQMEDGSVKQLTPELDDLVRPNDVLYVNERLF